MHNVKFAAAAVSVGLAIAGPAFAADPVDRIDQSFSSGYIKAAAVIMQRSDPNGGTIVGGNPGLAPYISGDDFDFGFEAGFDGAVGIFVTPKNAIELRTLQFGTSADLSVVTPGNFIGAGFTGPVGTLFEADYDTDLASWEVNWRREFNDRLTLMAGPRMISLDDTLDFRLNTIVARGIYDYDNNLLGVQIGAELSVLPATSPFQINITGKIGAYALESAGGIYEFQGDNFIGSFNTEIDDTVFAGEVDITAGYRATDNILIYAGYQALFVSDVALAGDNASFSIRNPPLLNSNIVRDDIVFHGATFGISVIW